MKKNRKSDPLMSIKPTKERAPKAAAARTAIDEYRAKRDATVGIKPWQKAVLGEHELPPKWPHPDTGQPLPPLLVAIEDIILWGGRTADALALAPIYKCSHPQIHKVIRMVKDEWLEHMAKTRQARVSKSARRLDAIVDRAFRSGDGRLAKDAIMDMSRLVGDMAPETHIMLGGDKDPEELLKQAEELKALARQESLDE